MTLDVSRAGTGRLHVRMSSGQSTATSVLAHSPLKILVPRPRGLSVWACVSTLGGGLVGGDQISIGIRLGEQARCFLGTQASTKIFRNPRARPCQQILQAELDRGALLAVIPDPVQSFRGANYRQRQKFVIHSESGLVLGDWLGSGRAARGERWAFSQFQSRNEIAIGDSKVLVDSLMLDPKEGPLADTYRMGRFNCLALVVVIGGIVQPFSARLLDEIARQPISRRAKLVSSASPIKSGTLVRLAGESVEEVAQRIRQHLDFLPSLLGDNPWTRKF